MGEYHQTKNVSMCLGGLQNPFCVADFPSVVFILKNFLDLVHTQTYITEVSDTLNFVFMKAEFISAIYHICV